MLSGKKQRTKGNIIDHFDRMHNGEDPYLNQQPDEEEMVQDEVEQPEVEQPEVEQPEVEQPDHQDVADLEPQSNRGRKAKTFLMEKVNKRKPGQNLDRDRDYLKKEKLEFTNMKPGHTVKLKSNRYSNALDIALYYIEENQKLRQQATNATQDVQPREVQVIEQ